MKDSQKISFENSQNKDKRYDGTCTMKKSRSKIEKATNSSMKEKSKICNCMHMMKYSYIYI